MNFKYLKIRKEGAVLWVEILNPPVNFLTVRILEELFSLVKSVEKDPSVRVFVLTGGIEDHYIMHFSIPELKVLSTDNAKLGMHLWCKTRIGRRLYKYINALGMWQMDWVPGYESLMLKLTRLIKGFSSTPYLWILMMRTYLAIERMNKVTIAAINGNCNGGGTELSSCFEFRFMIDDQDFTIGQAEILVGIIPGGGGSQRITRLIGKARALSWMLQGNFLKPAEAKSIGLITDHFTKNAFYQKVGEFALRMSRRIPVAVTGIKRSVHRTMETSLLKGLCEEMTQTVRCFDDQATQTAMADYANLLNTHIDQPDVPTVTQKELMEMVDSDWFDCLSNDR